MKYLKYMNIHTAKMTLKYEKCIFTISKNVLKSYFNFYITVKKQIKN